MTIFALVPVIGAGAVYVPVGLWLLVTGGGVAGHFRARLRRRDHLLGR